MKQRATRILAALFSLSPAFAVSGCNEQDRAFPSAAAEPQVGVITLHPQSVPIVEELPGRTVASAVAEIRPQVNGIIQKRVFAEGSRVESGDVLYLIDPRTYDATLNSAQADLQNAEAAVPSAQAKVDRYDKLAGVKGVAQQDIDEAHAALEQAKAQVAAAQAALQTAQINLEFTRVTAPISGLIGTSSETEGALVTANQTTALATIRQIDPIYVDLTAASGRILKVRKMIEENRITLNGPPKVRLTLEDGTIFDQVGEVISRGSNVDQTTDAVSIRASFANPEGMLLPGAYVRASVTLGEEPNSFLLPQRAVSRNVKGQATAYFLSADNKVEMRLFDTVRSYQTSWVVRDGVKDGDRLIVDGVQKIQVGATAKPVPVELDARGLVKDTGTETAAGRE